MLSVVETWWTISREMMKLDRTWNNWSDLLGGKSHCLTWLSAWVMTCNYCHRRHGNKQNVGGANGLERKNQTCCLQQDRERIKTWLLHGNFILFCQKVKRTCHLSEVWFRVGAVKEVPTETTFATPTESHEVEVNWFTRLGTTTWCCSRNHGSGATETWEMMMTSSWKQCGRQIVPDGSQ